ncbi:RNAse III [Dethiosulfatibacter aminovorans DSM 17477]|uniref:Ribonuclease 3 n=1 Tax=Dethiosulfatibacter aminovorans DSM 17477 TaxID=1121476 RepID=A0A1M6DGC2_9FIRM|nr:ribonuclease III [Dethiosulfatibacter aminovorans]SHI72384.1 RNAse III [Dethiosulfatibacter aminovorans DSM 17477]
MDNNLSLIEERLDYSFTDRELLVEALTHSSYSNENGQDIKNNERLEFLGDAVLEIMVSNYLFSKYKSMPEGKLTRLRSKVVCEEILYDIAIDIEIGKFLLLGKGEEITGGRERKSILADSIEAIIAAIFLDSNMDTVVGLFLPRFKKYINLAVTGKLNMDYKTRLQEIIQKDDSSKRIKYVVYKEEGPDHDKIFYVKVHLDKQTIGRGCGKSKKNAEQEAAKAALTSRGCIDEKED